MIATTIPVSRTPSADVTAIPALGHTEAMGLAGTEFDRMVELLRTLRADEWTTETVCNLWNVRSMVAHVVGMADAQASFRQFVHDFGAARKRSGGAMIDALNASQVGDRVDMSPAELVERLASVAPKAVRSRRRTPAVMRTLVRFKQDPPFETERWRLRLSRRHDLHARHVGASPRHLTRRPGVRCPSPSSMTVVSSPASSRSGRIATASRSRCASAVLPEAAGTRETAANTWNWMPSSSAGPSRAAPRATDCSPRPVPF